MARIDDQELARFDTVAQFRRWIAKNQDASSGIRLVIAKKGAPFTTVTREEALDVALEFGWIDGRSKRVDDESFEQYYSPRTPKSPWSQRNVDTVTAKIAAGEMQPRGMAEVEKAQADGRWDRAYSGRDAATLHPELVAALAENPEASATLETLNAQNRFLIYYRVQEAKRPETRARRIAQFVEKLAAGQREF